MRKNLHTNLTALTLALAATGKRRMEAEGKPEDKPASGGGSGKREMTAEQWEQQRRAELDKENSKDLLNRVIRLEADNFELRRKAAPEGGLVLTAEERGRWEAWEALGKLDDVKTALHQGKKDREVLQQQERRSELDRVAGAAGFDADTFAELDGLAGGLEYRVQEVKDKDSGETVKQAQVRAGDTWADLEAFATERWKKFLPVLQAEPESDKSTAGGADPEPARRVPTGGAGGGRGRSYTVEEAEKAKAESGQYVM
ncbi:hypothetical protein ACFP81_10630 [Deinococcus lacus]|uniref:Uncharacterized protein n=1 Tax=Deinococcus lacus TaxID=392561 RepID=A0ABW1YG40_9DEIO